MFDKFASRLDLNGWLTAETAFRIGAGRSTEVVGADLAVVRDADGKPYIPGSSFKGVLRARLESLARAVRDHRKIVCSPTEENEWCITKEEIADKKKELAQRSNADQQLTDWIGEEACLICLTFGSPWLASKVQVRDLLVEEKLWFGQFQMRNGVAIDRDTETADDGKLYDFEVIPSGVSFGFHLLVENGTPWQRGMVLAGLRAIENGEIALGGGRSRGLGAVKLELSKREFFEIGNDESIEAKIEKLFGFVDGKQSIPVSDEQAKAWVGEFKKQLARKAKEVSS